MNETGNSVRSDCGGREAMVDSSRVDLVTLATSKEKSIFFTIVKGWLYSIFLLVGISAACPVQAGGCRSYSPNDARLTPFGLLAPDGLRGPSVFADTSRNVLFLFMQGGECIYRMRYAGRIEIRSGKEATLLWSDKVQQRISVIRARQIRKCETDVRRYVETMQAQLGLEAAESWLPEAWDSRLGDADSLTTCEGLVLRMLTLGELSDTRSVYVLIVVGNRVVGVIKE
ncbi:hypothetical protein [Gemmobacter denitrificans]|uniref:Uncharacterized protein n=1 Tax=Gemmobacter denitrificans TaxID=3123040 RepID=A0ABU8C0J3_9RHOB